MIEHNSYQTRSPFSNPYANTFFFYINSPGSLFSIAMNKQVKYAACEEAGLVLLLNART